MKTSLLILIAVAFNAVPIHADDSIYYQTTAQSILNTLQTKATELNSDESAALAVLNSSPDMPETSATHAAAEALLTESFSGLFTQPDNVQGPIQTTGILFGGPRDLYTFCPAGSAVGRHLSQKVSEFTGQTENIWSWSFCAAPDLTSVDKAVRVQDLWVTNVQHPILTLQIVTDERPGEKTNLEIDLNQLVAGKIPVSQILSAISPD